MANTHKRINVAGTGTDDKKVKVSSDDSIAEFLEDKITTTSGKVTATTTSPGGTEKVDLDVDESQIDHTLIANIGTNSHAQIDSHISDVGKHREINDVGSTTIDLWSANKIQTELDTKQSTSEKGNANGYAGLDGSGKVPVAQLPNAIMEYKGIWNATTNSPTLADGAGNPDTAIGDVYRVGTAGSQDLGSGSITFGIGDYVILNSSKIWEKADNTDAVSSVFSRTGAITAQASDYNASQVDYNNVTSGLAATDVQAAIDELEGAHPVGTIVGTTDSQVLTNKTFDADLNTLSNVDNADIKAAAGIVTSKLADSIELSESVTFFSSTNISGAEAETLTDGSDAASLHNHDSQYPVILTGDLQQTTFSGIQSQIGANVTGFAFNNANVRSFEAQLSIFVSATANLSEEFTIKGIQRGSDWVVTVASIGDDTLIDFDMSATGQLIYDSSSYAGFSSMTMKFRSLVTSV